MQNESRTPVIDRDMTREALVLLEEERVRHMRVMSGIERLLRRALGGQVVFPLSAEMLRPDGRAIAVKDAASPKRKSG